MLCVQNAGQVRAVTQSSACRQQLTRRTYIAQYLACEFSCVLRSDQQRRSAGLQMHLPSINHPGPSSTSKHATRVMRSGDTERAAARRLHAAAQILLSAQVNTTSQHVERTGAKAHLASKQGVQRGTPQPWRQQVRTQQLCLLHAAAQDRLKLRVVVMRMSASLHVCWCLACEQWS